MKYSKFKIFTLLLIVINILGCSSHHLKNSYYDPVEKLKDQLYLQISEPELETAFIGIMVQSVETGEILFRHNANKMMMPASNEKIPTSAAALIKFGPDFQYETKLYTTGSIIDSVLNGDLVVVGSGDPTIGYRLCGKDDSCSFLKSWATALKNVGINEINGNLVGVDDIFDDDAIGYGWTMNNLSYSYAAQIGGLMLHENFVRVSLIADSLTKKIKIKTLPKYDFVNITCKVIITENKKDDTGISIQRIEGTNDVIISGKLLLGDVYRRNISIHNPTLYFLRGLRYELEQSEIAVIGNEVDSDDLADSLKIDEMRLIHTHNSQPFSEVIKILMKESQNLYAESFIKLLGAHFGKEGSFVEGEKVLKQTLRRLGLDKQSFAFSDGSGLCRYNYISPNHLVKIFRRMYYHPYGEIYRNSLPIAGVDGTIGYRMKGTAADSNVTAKTGTISNVRCLSGYVTTKDNEVLVFSTMINNFLCDVHVVMDMQDRICMLLSSFSRKK